MKKPVKRRVYARREDDGSYLRSVYIPPAIWKDLNRLGQQMGISRARLVSLIIVHGYEALAEHLVLRGVSIPSWLVEALPILAAHKEAVETQKDNNNNAEQNND